jgi:hypothetical protein
MQGGAELVMEAQTELLPVDAGAVALSKGSLRVRTSSECDGFRIQVAGRVLCAKMASDFEIVDAVEGDFTLQIHAGEVGLTGEDSIPSALGESFVGGQRIVIAGGRIISVEKDIGGVSTPFGRFVTKQSENSTDESYAAEDFSYPLGRQPLTIFVS